jgi:hypothetical protein
MEILPPEKPLPTKSETQDKWERSQAVVYFIAAGQPPVAIKIGITGRAEKSVRHRLRAIQSSNHMFIELLGAIPFEQGKRPMLAAQTHEGELHRQFARLQRFERTWVGSEWFTCDDELLYFIRDHATAPEQLGLPRTIGRPVYIPPNVT